VHSFKNSSNLDNAEYGNGVIAVTFKNGKTYHYPDSTLKDFQDLCAAKSPGNYFFKNFRKKTFRLAPSKK
jgi:hypothetical protein